MNINFESLLPWAIIPDRTRKTGAPYGVTSSNHRAVTSEITVLSVKTFLAWILTEHPRVALLTEARTILPATEAIVLTLTHLVTEGTVSVGWTGLGAVTTLPSWCAEAMTWMDIQEVIKNEKKYVVKCVTNIIIVHGWFKIILSRILFTSFCCIYTFNSVAGVKGCSHLCFKFWMSVDT